VLVLRGRLSFLGGVRRRTWAVNIREWGGGGSTSRVLRKWVSEFEMGRREHTIDGAIAIDRVHDAPCGGGPLFPRPPVAPFPPLPVSFVAGPTWHARMDRWRATSVVWWWRGLWGTTTVAIAVVVGVGVVRGRGGSSVVGEGGGLSCMMVVGRETLCIVSHAKSSVGVCRRPF
jgi:hypothetical protein